LTQNCYSQGHKTLADGSNPIGSSEEAMGITVIR
jgi:hypothetical protein